MSYRDSPHYLEARARLQRKQRCKTALGKVWQHQQYIAALKALLGNHNTKQKGG